MQNLGIEVAIEQAFGLQSAAGADGSELAGKTFGNSVHEYAGGLRYRIPFGAGHQVWISGTAGEHAFVFTSPSDCSGCRAMLHIPDTIYRFGRPGIGLRLELPGDFYRSRPAPAIATSSTRAARTWTDTSRTGPSAAWMSTWRWATGSRPIWKIRGSGQLRRYFYDMHSKAGDAYLAGGAIRPSTGPSAWGWPFSWAAASSRPGRPHLRRPHAPAIPPAGTGHSTHMRIQRPVGKTFSRAAAVLLAAGVLGCSGGGGPDVAGDVCHKADSCQALSGISAAQCKTLIDTSLTSRSGGARTDLENAYRACIGMTDCDGFRACVDGLMGGSGTGSGGSAGGTSGGTGGSADIGTGGSAAGGSGGSSAGRRYRRSAAGGSTGGNAAGGGAAAAAAAVPEAVRPAAEAERPAPQERGPGRAARERAAQGRAASRRRRSW